ncbi:MAG: WD40/YVTN/BNR-like repeat-containing protein [Planctomycetota bacterium]|jgi:photosystem II stability/assembly factor-like uncharacterized protein
MSDPARCLRLSLPCLLLAAACSAPADEPFTKKPKSLVYPRVSGAYRALSFWGDSRAYPARDIPRDAYARAWEAAQPAFVSPSVQVSRPQPDPGIGWTALGPNNNGGRTLTVAFDPGDPDTVWAGAASGGLWRSTTGGVGASAWQYVDTGHPVLGVSTIAFAPDDPDVLYIGTGEVYNVAKSGDLEADRRTRGSYGIGILKSTDGGASWVKSLDWSYNQRHGVWAVRVDPAAPSVVWAATTDGVYKSLDAGRNWTKKLPVVMAMDLVVHPVATDTVLAACGDLGTAGRGIYRTTDGGDTWTAVTAVGLPTDFLGKIQIGVTPADPDVVYASIGNGFEVFGPENFTWLFRSVDFGASFSLRSTIDYSKWQGWYAHDVDVSPTDPDTIVCAGIDSWKSTDGGLTLVQESDYTLYFTGETPPGAAEGPPDYSHADHHDVVFHPTDPDIVYFANDGGISRSLDGGETFRSLNGGYQTTQFYNGSVSMAPDPDLAMGGLQDNGSVIYRGDGSWQRWVLGGDGGWCAIDPNDPDIVYATAQFLFVGKSFDGGNSFFNISPPDLGGPVAFIAPFVMSPTDSLILYAGSDYLFKSFDGGSQWFIGQGGVPIDGNPLLLLAVAQQNDDVLYLATAPHVSRGKVHRTLDGGSTFTEITGTLPDRYPGDMATDPVDEATVYLTMSGFGSSHVFRSTDYGDSWVDIDGGKLPDVPTTAVVVDPDKPGHVYVGNDIGVWRTTNGGASWARLPQGLSAAVLVNELGISPTDRKLRAFTHGRRAWEHGLLGN